MILTFAKLRGTLLDTGLVSIEEAARNLGMDVKRLRGYVHRDSVHHGDPIGSLETDQVYGWSLRHLAASSTSGLTAIPGQAHTVEAGEVGK